MTPANVLVAADPAALVLRYLQASTALQGLLGGPGHVGGVNRPPYPRVVVTDPPGGFIRPTPWLLDTEYLVEVLGDPDGRHGREVLRRICLTVEAELAGLPDAPRLAGDPVVTAVSFFGAGGYTTTAAGQARYIATATVSSHPPVTAPP